MYEFGRLGYLKLLALPSAMMILVTAVRYPGRHFERRLKASFTETGYNRLPDGRPSRLLRPKPEHDTPGQREDGTIAFLETDPKSPRQEAGGCHHNYWPIVQVRSHPVVLCILVVCINTGT
jgi:hypothetical protein